MSIQYPAARVYTCAIKSPLRLIPITLVLFLLILEMYVHDLWRSCGSTLCFNKPTNRGQYSAGLKGNTTSHTCRLASVIIQKKNRMYRKDGHCETYNFLLLHSSYSFEANSLPNSHLSVLLGASSGWWKRLINISCTSFNSLSHHLTNEGPITFCMSQGDVAPCVFLVRRNISLVQCFT